MATLLGKWTNEPYECDSFAKIAFNIALDYLPDSNFLYRNYYVLCKSNNVRFNDAGIDGSCVIGTHLKVYAYKVPSATAELYIYKSNLFWYITTKCKNKDILDCYIEFVFEEESIENKGFSVSNIYSF